MGTKAPWQQEGGPAEPVVFMGWEEWGGSDPTGEAPALTCSSGTWEGDRAALPSVGQSEVHSADGEVRRGIYSVIRGEKPPPQDWLWGGTNRGSLLVLQQQNGVKTRVAGFPQRR